MWLRYIFKTFSVEDYRPLVFNPQFPWWCSAENGETATIIAWLPDHEKLLEYWDDAEDIEYSEHEKIEFSPRFPKPEGFVES